jgi:phosphate transport system substrate-binding protein
VFKYESHNIGESFMLKKMTLAIASFMLATTVNAAEITGAGATFPFPVYAKWANDYKAATGNQVNYQSIGSGAGIKQIQAKTVIFGATDMPLSLADLLKDRFVQWPEVIGGIVLAVNVDGVQSGNLVLDGATVANIYLGKIKKWDDAAIVKLNPIVKLPSAAITVVRRSDGSGTTFNFTNYLSKVSDDWKNGPGEGSAVEFPVGIGAKGNEGVAGNVQQTKNSIGYVEYAYAKQNKLSTTKMVNSAGKTVEPSMKSFSSAAAKAEWHGVPGMGVILTNQPGDDSWPITAATFILMYSEPTDPAASRAAIAFFNWAFENGNKSAEELDYIPMPANVIKEIKTSVWTMIKH